MIFETIIISTDEEDTAHVTPFGVKYEGDMVIISPFKPSKTLNNILLTKTATMNLTDDVRVFAGALTNRQPWKLVQADSINGYRLSDCLTHVELQLVDVREDEMRPQLVMKQLNTVTHGHFKGFNRAQAAVIELAVLSSRLTMLPPEKIQDEFKYLEIAIDKTAGEREHEAWLWLVDKINQFYEKKFV